MIAAVVDDAVLMGVYLPIIIMALGGWVALFWRAIWPEIKSGTFDGTRHALGIGAVLLLTADAFENLWYGSARWFNEHHRMLEALPSVGGMKVLIVAGCVFVWTAVLHNRVERPLLVSSLIAALLWSIGTALYLLVHFHWVTA